MFEKEHIIFFPGFNVEKLIIWQELYLYQTFAPILAGCQSW